MTSEKPQACEAEPMSKVLASFTPAAPASHSTAEASLLDTSRREAAEAVIVLTVVRTGLPPEEQAKVDDQLLRATARGSHAKMKVALSEGAQASGDYALTPLMLALAARDEVAAQILGDAGAPEPTMKPEAETLGRAFGRGDLADVVRLLARGADPNVRLHRGEGVQDTSHGTPLHACCALHQLQGSTALVELLCRLGADTAARDGEGDSALAHARYFNASDIYESLEYHGATILGPYYSAFHVAGRRFLGWR